MNQQINTGVIIPQHLKLLPEYLYTFFIVQLNNLNFPLCMRHVQ